MILKNGNIHTCIEENIMLADIEIQDGKITKIGKDLQGEDIIDVTGKHIYPGFIDCHCHVGVCGSGIGFEGSDGNETTDSLTPHIRAIDGINPLDESFELARNAGITCIGTGPGSANVIGGTFVALKTVGKRVDDMIVKNPVAMKCAFGENPKKCYKDKSSTTRMAIAANLRNMLFKAQEYKLKKENAGDDISKMPAFDMKLEALIPVLNKEIPLKAHAHQVNDIFTSIRIAEEFGLDLTLEHVTEGHLIVDELKDMPYMMAVGPSFTFPSKFEIRQKSFVTPGVLSKAGCHVSIITDSPVVPIQQLSLMASLAIKEGMDPFKALQAITINPARHLGIEDRVGSIEVGKDADIVVCDKDIFDTYVNVESVFIDGKQVK